MGRAMSFTLKVLEQLADYSLGTAIVVVHEVLAARMDRSRREAPPR